MTTSTTVNAMPSGATFRQDAGVIALVGAAAGESGIPARLIDGLADSAAIRAEIDAFVAAALKQQQ